MHFFFLVVMGGEGGGVAKIISLLLGLIARLQPAQLGSLGPHVGLGFRV